QDNKAKSHSQNEKGMSSLPHVFPVTCTCFLSSKLLHLRQAIGGVEWPVKRNAIMLQPLLERTRRVELGQRLVDRLAQSRVALTGSHVFVPADDSRRFITCNEEQFQLRMVA